jgi:hypothetical protein
MTALADPNSRILGAGVSQVAFTSVTVSGNTATIGARAHEWTSSVVRQQAGGNWLDVSPAGRHHLQHQALDRAIRHLVGNGHDRPLRKRLRTMTQRAGVKTSSSSRDGRAPFFGEGSAFGERVSGGLGLSLFTGCGSSVGTADGRQDTNHLGQYVDRCRPVDRCRRVGRCLGGRG